MLEVIKLMLEEFNSFQIQSNWTPYLAIYIFVFLILFINYLRFHKNQLMKKVFQIHEFTEVNDDETKIDCHFHNTDLAGRNFKIKDAFFKEKFRWDGRRLLFIPKGKVNSIVKKGRKITLWYNGYVSKGYTYKYKKFLKDWTKRKVYKSKITNFSGLFIIGNTLVRTSNISSIEIDTRDIQNVLLTYIFNNGSEHIIRLTMVDFFNNMVNSVLPYNIAFLGQCDLIELR